ncbi:DUF6538 domain-containing protein [Marinobacter sp.]|uniref:DUF6538 domain-containing protein n=1 Tax=Marinobacter sp. TaxID=50741 RepID=UPI00384FF231
MSLRMANPVKDRNGTYICRVGVPAQLRKIIGKRELKPSLGTKEPKIAKLRFGPVYAEFTQLLENARRQAKGEPLLSTHDTDVLADRWLEQTLDRAERSNNYRFWYHWVEETDRATGAHHRYPDSPFLNAIAETVKTKGDEALVLLVEEALGDELSRLLTEHRLFLSRESADYQRLAKRIAARVGTLVDHLSRRELGRYSSPSHTLAKQVLTKETKPKGMTITEAWAEYQKRLHREQGEQAARARIDDYNAAITGLAEFLGDLPLNEISPDQLREYRDFLYELPNRPSKAIRQLPIRERAAKADAKGLKTLSRVTVRNRMIHCSALFRSALDMPGSGLESNPLESVTLPPRTSRQDQGKQPEFLPEELDRVFGGSWFLSPPRGLGSSAIWLPLVLYYTGARLEEIAPLDARDVREVQGQWVIDISPRGGEQNGQESAELPDCSSSPRPDQTGSG